MSTKLISYTQAVNTNINSIEELVTYCARVSNPESQQRNLNNEKLIKYLLDNSHFSPFEMVNICIEINTTRDISRQILRHRSFSFQEYSQRYAEVNNNVILREARLQDLKNRQNSIPAEDEVLQERWKNKQALLNEVAHNYYTWAISNGIAKEQARVVLPEGNTQTTLLMNGSLRSWIHYINLRIGNGTQKEHSCIAYECYNIIKEIFPLITHCIKV